MSTDTIKGLYHFSVIRQSVVTYQTHMIKMSKDEKISYTPLFRGLSVGKKGIPCAAEFVIPDNIEPAVLQRSAAIGPVDPAPVYLSSVEIEQ